MRGGRAGWDDAVVQMDSTGPLEGGPASEGGFERCVNLDAQSGLGLLKAKRKKPFTALGRDSPPRPAPLGIYRQITL